MCENIADIDVSSLHPPLLPHCCISCLMLTPRNVNSQLKNVESTFQSNIVAMIAMAKYSVPHMKRGGTIVNSTSVTAFKGERDSIRSRNWRMIWLTDPDVMRGGFVHDRFSGDVGLLLDQG